MFLFLVWDWFLCLALIGCGALVLLPCYVGLKKKWVEKKCRILKKKKLNKVCHGQKRVSNFHVGLATV
jgi:hypothetical protein